MTTRRSAAAWSGCSGPRGTEVEVFAASRAFIERVSTSGADCLVLDVRMPGPSGLDVQHLLVSAGHDVPIIFVTGTVTSRWPSRR